MRSIGVSNFQVSHLERLAAEAEVMPAVNQVEAHPYFGNEEVRAYGLAGHLRGLARRMFERRMAELWHLVGRGSARSLAGRHQQVLRDIPLPPCRGARVCGGERHEHRGP